MPIINQVIGSLGELEVPPVDLAIVDGDETLFPHGSADPFPDAVKFIGSLQSAHVVLVSANPDADIARSRVQALDLDNVVIPRLPKWIKYGLFNRAIDQSLDVIGSDKPLSALVVGDRWAMDVAAARLALLHRRIDSTGVLIDRPEATYSQRFDRFITRPVEAVGATILKAVGQDHHIRPRCGQAILD